MYRVSDEQIEFILDDIKKRGVEMEDLQLNLLDHICCIIEREYNETDDFNTIYNTTIKQFFKTELWEIEEETLLLLKYKNYYKMKRFLYILFVLSIGFNVYVLSKMGYEYYKLKKRQSDMELMQKVNFSDGFADFKNKLRAEHPEVLKNKYIFVSFSNNFWEDDLTGSTIDTSFINEYARSRLRGLKLNDSLASSFSNNISFVYAYNQENTKIYDQIEKNKEITKHFVYVTGLATFWNGYKNEKRKEGAWIPLIIIIDTTGKPIYERGITAQRIDKKLISTLKSIQ